MSPDSVTYLSAAQSFETNRSFIGVDGLPLTNWPPLYPILLSVVNGALLNQLSLIVSAFLIWNLLQNVHHRTLLTTVAVLSFPLLKLSSMIWSELVFISLLLALLAVLKRNNALQSNNWLFAIWLLIVFLCLQRYVGVFFAITLLCMALRYRQYKLSVVVLLGLLPLAGWFIRNHLVKSNTPFDTFVHWDNGYQNLKLCIEALSFPPTWASVLPWIIWLLTILIAAWFIVDTIRKPHFTWHSYLKVASLVYLLVVLHWSLLAPIELARYMLPLFPLVILMLHVSLSRYGWILWILLAINLVILLWQTQNWIKEGAGGYSRHDWKRLPVKEVVLSLPDDSYMSNASDVIYIETGKRCPFAYSTTKPYKYIIWIKPVKRLADLYPIWLKQGYTVIKDSADIQLLSKD